MTTFKALQDKIAAMPGPLTGVADRVDDILDRARWNADDTVYCEKARSAEEYDSIALATVADILSYSTDKEACAWFKAQGVEW